MGRPAEIIRNIFIHALVTLVVLSGTIVAACSGSSSGSPALPTSAALEIFDALWSDFDVSYSFFELKGIDWEISRTRFRSELSSTSTDSELFNVLSDMLLELEDPHVRLDTPMGESVYTGWFDRFPANHDESVVTATYLGSSAMMSPQVNMLFGEIDTDIGYLSVHSLSGVGFGSDIDFVLNQMQGTRALIIDVRSNGGGNDQNGEAIAARFADMTRLYRRVRFRDGPDH